MGAAVAAGAGMARKRLRGIVGSVCTRNDQRVVTASPQSHVGEVVLSARRDGADLQGKDQQHEHRQPRGRAQSGKHRAGRSWDHPHTIHTYRGVMEFHLEPLCARLHALPRVASAGEEWRAFGGSTARAWMITASIRSELPWPNRFRGRFKTHRGSAVSHLRTSSVHLHVGRRQTQKNHPKVASSCYLPTSDS